MTGMVWGREPETVYPPLSFSTSVGQLNLSCFRHKSVEDLVLQFLAQLCSLSTVVPLETDGSYVINND